MTDEDSAAVMSCIGRDWTEIAVLDGDVVVAKITDTAEYAVRVGGDDLGYMNHREMGDLLADAL